MATSTWERADLGLSPASHLNDLVYQRVLVLTIRDPRIDGAGSRRISISASFLLPRKKAKLRCWAGAGKGGK